MNTMRNYGLSVCLLLLLAVTSGICADEETSSVPTNSTDTASTAPQETINVAQNVTSNTPSDNSEPPTTGSPETEIPVTSNNTPLSSQVTVTPEVSVASNQSSPLSNPESATPEVVVTPNYSSPLSSEVTSATADDEVTLTPPVVTVAQSNSTEAPPAPAPQTTAKEEPPAEASATRLCSFALVLELLLSTLILSLAL